MRVTTILPTPEPGGKEGRLCSGSPEGALAGAGAEGRRKDQCFPFPPSRSLQCCSVDEPSLKPEGRGNWWGPLGPQAPGVPWAPRLLGSWAHSRQRRRRTRVGRGKQNSLHGTTWSPWYRVLEDARGEEDRGPHPLGLAAFPRAGWQQRLLMIPERMNAVSMLW